MTSVAIHLDDRDTPEARIIAGQHGRWISLELGGSSVYLPDYEAGAAVYARRVARALLRAADELDRYPVASEDDVARAVGEAYAPVLDALAKGETP